MKARGSAFRPGGFGLPGGVNPTGFHSLPEVMQAEGIALLREMRLSDFEVRRHLHLSREDFQHLTNVQFVPFRRGGELTLAGDHE